MEKEEQKVLRGTQSRMKEQAKRIKNKKLKRKQKQIYQERNEKNGIREKQHEASQMIFKTISKKKTEGKKKKGLRDKIRCFSKLFSQLHHSL